MTSEEAQVALKGGCLCGAIRYEANVAARFSLICQCRPCQQITGTGHSTQFAVASAHTKLSGELTYFSILADSGHTVRSGFCGVCGSPVLRTTTRFDDLLLFHAGSLDDPSVFSADMAVHTSSGQPWDHLDPSLSRE